MSTVVVDTNVVSFLFKGHTLAQVYRPHLENKALAISGGASRWRVNR